MTKEIEYYDGPAYEESADLDRLQKQSDKIHDLMKDSEWRTLEEISVLTGYPESSISAQLRHFRKPRFQEVYGIYIIDKRRKGNRESGLWEYQLRKPLDNEIVPVSEKPYPDLLREAVDALKQCGNFLEWNDFSGSPTAKKVLGVLKKLQTQHPEMFK